MNSDYIRGWREGRESVAKEVRAAIEHLKLNGHEDAAIIVAMLVDAGATA